MGSGQSLLLNNEDLHCLREADIHPVHNNVQSFKKLFHRGVRYTTHAYSVGKKNDDSWIKIRNGLRGRIDKIYHITTQEGHVVALLLQEVVTDRQPFMRTRLVTVSHIKCVTEMGGLKAIQPSKIVAQCIFMGLEIGNYIVDMPFACYGD